MTLTPPEPTSDPLVVQRTADLVFEGGGVKGIALVGTAVALADNGYSFARVAGSSAGAIVGAIVAAMEKAGEPLGRADEIMRTLDYTKMLDRRGISRAFKFWPLAANALGLLFYKGMHQGAYLQDWTRGVLADLGVRTFADLKFPDPGSALPDTASMRVRSRSPRRSGRLLRSPSCSSRSSSSPTSVRRPWWMARSCAAIRSRSSTVRTTCPAAGPLSVSG